MKLACGHRAASAGEAAISAAIISVGLMRESRFRIRSVTAHAYACDMVVATRLSGERTRK
jgi:hypothetical protein